MPVGALFGSSAARTQSKNLVEMKAGKMTLKGKMVNPDKRKGLIYVYQSDDSLMHFCWKDRQTGTVEDDLIIFPDDCEFKRVEQCTTGRVYVLKFKSSSRRFFFWVQEPKTDKDDENCRRINEVLNNPPTLASQRSGGGTPDGDLQNLLNNMSQQQLMQLFGGVGQIGGLSSLLGTMSRPSSGQSSRSASSTTTTASPTSTTSTVTSAANSTTPATSSVTSTTSAPAKTTSAEPAKTTSTTSAAASTTTTTAATAVTATTTTTTTTATTASSSSSSSKPASGQSTIQLSDLQNFLSGLNVPSGEANNQRTAVDLSSALTMENLQTLLGDTALVRELQQHLPPSSTAGTPPPPASEQLRSTLSSSQFRQALSMFSAALQSGQLGPVVQQFEVGSEAVDAANQGNMEEFIRALQSAGLTREEADEKPGGDEKRKKTDDSGKKDEDDDEDNMSVD